MFICNQCLEERFENAESIAKSKGRCELCAAVAVCHDIPSRFLVTKCVDEKTAEKTAAQKDMYMSIHGHGKCHEIGIMGGCIDDCSECEGFKDAPEDIKEAYRTYDFTDKVKRIRLLDLD